MADQATHHTHMVVVILLSPQTQHSTIPHAIIARILMVEFPLSLFATVPNSKSRLAYTTTPTSAPKRSTALPHDLHRRSVPNSPTSLPSANILPQQLRPAQQPYRLWNDPASASLDRRPLPPPPPAINLRPPAGARHLLPQPHRAPHIVPADIPVRAAHAAAAAAAAASAGSAGLLTVGILARRHGRARFGARRGGAASAPPAVRPPRAVRALCPGVRRTAAVRAGPAGACAGGVSGEAVESGAGIRRFTRTGAGRPGTRAWTVGVSGVSSA